MRIIQRIAAAILLVLALAGCEGEPPKPVELLPAEAFSWTGGQPVSFSPPPAGWSRSRYQNGGMEGVDFIKSGSVGEQIFVAERLFVGNRDRCEQLQKISRELDGYDSREFQIAIQKARRFAQSALNADDRRKCALIDATLDRARQMHRAGEMALVHVELGVALEEAASVRYTLEQTVDRALFTAAGNTVYPKLQVEEPVTGSLAGEPAVIVKFTFESHGATLLGRRIYTLHNNRMFELGYQGLEENLPLFERIAESVTFPQGPCEH